MRLKRSELDEYSKVIKAVTIKLDRTTGRVPTDAPEVLTFTVFRYVGWRTGNSHATVL